MKTTTVSIVLEALICILEKEGIELESITFNIQGTETKAPFIKLLDLAKKDLEQLQTESSRLDFMAENRLRAEKWNTSPCVQMYYIMNDDDVSIAQDKDLRTAIDMAIELSKTEIVDSLGEVP